MEGNDPLGVANLDPRGMVGMIYKGTTRYCCMCLMVWEKIFKMFSIISLRELLTPQGGASLDHRGLIGRIYVGHR